MTRSIIRHAIILCITYLVSIIPVSAQNSLLVNFGADSCNGSGSPAFSLIKNPLSDTASALISCSLASEVPDFFAVFIAYNPMNNKMYAADIRTGITKIWVLDVGLPGNISCPATIDSVPDYSYSYVSNNFEFDKNGNLWSFSAYNDTLGQCNIDNFDINTGTVLNTRIVQFPTGNFPSDITSGDLAILPNGRLFATLGSFPSRLYEITNYNTTTNATATFLDTIPNPCFGIAYLNGELELTGTDFSGDCYYYIYHIASHQLDSIKNFQAGELPIDNTSITPSVGVSKQVINSSKVNYNTADITYGIFVKNLGNVALNNINVSDNLAAVYGARNISNINVAFSPGENVANLVLNPAYNGIDDTLLLMPGQNLSNPILNDSNYFFALRISCQVTNLNPGIIYENSAIGTATIGSENTSSFINVADSSNNGPESAIDPNNDGNATEPGENVPTPFNFGTLPVHFIDIYAKLPDRNSALIQWDVATPTINSDKFGVEFSTDGQNWTSLAIIPISNINQSTYHYLHTNIPEGNLFYRIKETDIDGSFIYSDVVSVVNNYISHNYILYPNPANNYIVVNTSSGITGHTDISLFDVTGRLLFSNTMTGTNESIPTTSLPEGTYLLQLKSGGYISTYKVIIEHR
jgi:Secretion system C-terminal sorting domain